MNICIDMLSKLNKNQINYLNRLITTKDVEAVIKYLSAKKKRPRLDSFSTEFYQTFKVELIIVLLKLFHKNRNRRKVTKFFLKSQIPNHTKIQQERESQTKFPCEHWYKILNKMLAKQIQEYINKIIHHDQVSFVPEMQRWFNMQKFANVIHQINKVKEKEYITGARMNQQPGPEHTWDRKLHRKWYREATTELVIQRQRLLKIWTWIWDPQGSR